MCRRYLADAQDFSDENLEALSLEQRFHNDELNTCMEAISRWIREKQSV